MNILVTICARAGSKGVKNKNVKCLNGIPLVKYTLDAYDSFRKNRTEDIDLAVNTDSMELIEQVKNYNAECAFIERESALAGDRVGKLAVIKDTLVKMEAAQEKHYDYLIDLDLTSPLREDGDIEGTFKALLNKEDCDVAFSVVPSRRLPWFNMVKDNGDGGCSLVIESNYLTRQEAPACFDMNASIYVYTTAFLRNNETTKVLDGRATYYVMKDYGVLDIDSEEDFFSLEDIIRRRSRNEVL
jgi:CMP-N,N'-diacetyllegionaminic acid synthase